MTAAVLAAALRPASAAFTARYAAAYVLLPEGDTLVIGGATGTPFGSVLTSVQRISRLDGSVTDKTGLSVAVASHTATVLADGEVLVAGGANVAGTALNNIQIYNPITDTWRAPAFTLTTTRKNHTATALKDGRVLICGGENAGSGYNATCDIYCPPSGASATACPSGEALSSVNMLDPNGRTLHTSVRLSDGRVLLSGGFNSSSGYLITQELFNPTGNTFGAAHSLIQAREHHRASMLGNGKVLLVGGFNGRDVDGSLGFLSSTEIYDPVSDTISPGGAMSSRKSEQAQYVNNNGTVDIYGGLGNVTTAYQQISAPVVVTSQLIGQTPYADTLPKLTLDGPATSAALQIRLTNVPIGDAKATGSVITGAILLSTVTIPNLTSQNTDRINFIVPNGVETSPGVYSGAYIDLAGTAITDPGVITGVFPVTVTSGYMDFSPHTGISLSATAAGGTVIHFPSPTDAASGTEAITSAGSAIVIPLTITGLPAEYVGGTVLSAELDMISGVSISSQNMATFSLTAGKAVFSGQTVAADANGQGTLTLPSVTFDNLAGTVSPQCSTAGCLDDTNFNSGNGLVAQQLGGSAILKMVVSPITLNAGETFDTGISTIIIRRMAFGDLQTYNPTTNDWKTEIHGFAAHGMGAVLQPSGSALLLGGRDCGSGCGELTDAAIIPELEAPVLDNTNKMSQARGNHTTTLLPDGTMLVAGGSNGSNVLATAEIFDPVAKTFTQVQPMSDPRDLHTATLLANGNVLIVGGFTTNAISTGSTAASEIYYPKAHAFKPTSPLVTFGNVISSATNHTATLLADGSVLVAGGYQSGPGGITYLKSAALYYSTSATWVPLPNMPVNRAQHTATLLQDGRVLLAGGVNESGLLSGANFGLIFDPNFPGYWYSASAQATGLQSAGATALQDGRVLIAGGNDGFGESRKAFVYKPGGQGAGSGSWTQTLIDMNVGRFNETVTALPNGKVAAIGGATALGNSVTNIETYDVQSSSWQMMTNQLVTRRANHTTTVGLDGKIYIIGGFDGSSMLTTYESVYFTGTTDGQTPNVTDPSIRKSSITAIDATPFERGQAITLRGLRLTGAGEAGGGAGGSGGSSHDAPRVMMQALEASSGGGSQSGGGFALDLTTRVYRATNQNLFSNLATSMTITMPGSSASAGNLLPYGWYAMRTNSNAIYADGFVVQAGPANHAGPPGGIAGAVLGISSITWSWTASTGTFDGYAVYSASSGIFIGTTSAVGPWSCEDPPAAPITNPCLIQTKLAPNTTGAIMVAAYNLSGDGPLTFSNTAYTYANPPIGVSISSVGFNSLQLTWDTNGNTPGTIYEITQSSDDFATDFSTPIPTLVNLTSTSAAISPLSLNTTYYFRVRAFNGVGVASDFSTSVSTRTRAPIFNLTGTAIETTKIEWTWSDPGGTTGFNVYNSTTGAKLGSTVTPFFFDAGLSTNTQRSVMVTAVTSAGEGPLSEGATVYTLAATPIAGSPPITTVSTNSFTGIWNPNGNRLGTQYTMTVFDDAGVQISSSAITQTFSAGFSGFAFTSQPFTAKVVAINGDGIQTAPVVLGSSSTLAMAPANVFVTNTTPSSISVSWSNQSNGSTTTYEVSFSTNDFGSIQTFIPFSSNVNTTSATITGLLTSTTYSIRVQAENKLGVKSAFSNTVTTSPFNGGVPLGSLGVQINHLADTLLQGSIGNGRQLTLFAPTGSFTTDTFLTISTFDATVSPCPGGVNVAFDITPDPQLEPLTPLTLTLAYAPSDLGGAPDSEATLMRVTDSGACVPVQTKVDSNSHVITALLNHISRFQLAQVSPATSANTTFVFPNPLYLSQGQGYFTFSQMPAGSRVRVFTMRGELLSDQTANDSGLSTWNATNLQGRKVASGVYLVAVEAPDKTKKIVKAVVIR